MDLSTVEQKLDDSKYTSLSEVGVSITCYEQNMDMNVSDNHLLWAELCIF